MALGVHLQELEAAGDDDVSGYLLFPSRGLTHRVALDLCLPRKESSPSFTNHS